MCGKSTEHRTAIIGLKLWHFLRPQTYHGIFGAHKSLGPKQWSSYIRRLQSWLLWRTCKCGEPVVHLPHIILLHAFAPFMLALLHTWCQEYLREHHITSRNLVAQNKTIWVCRFVAIWANMGYIAAPRFTVIPLWYGHMAIAGTPRYCIKGLHPSCAIHISRTVPRALVVWDFLGATQRSVCIAGAKEAWFRLGDAARGALPTHTCFGETVAYYWHLRNFFF